ncbi:hypothetical protein ACQJBY_006187 [Aegilops geniculata]
MASIVSKLARAAVATRASPSAVGGIAGGCHRRFYLTGGDIRVSPAGGPKSEEVKARPKSEEEEKAKSEEVKARPNSEEEEKAKSEEVNARSKLEEALQAAMADPYAHFEVDEDSLKSKESMWALYEHWCKFHGISRDPKEMARRFRIFSDSARLVHEVNNSGGPFEMSLTKFSDLTREEKSRRLGCKPRRK